MTTGLKKLKQKMDDIGYKKICEMTGLKRSILYGWLDGSRDPKKMSMVNAIALKKELNIDFKDWEKEIEGVKDEKMPDKEVQKFDIDWYDHIECPVCKSKKIVMADKEPWHDKYICFNCSKIIDVYFQDRMSGVYTDAIEVHNIKPD